MAPFWGPCYFCYINDLPRSIKSKVRMYADDTLVYNVVISIDDCVQLQNDILLLERWASIWQMQFNPSKCEFLAITNKTSTARFTHYINEIPIKAVQHAKHLGVTIDSRLTINMEGTHQDNHTQSKHSFGIPTS